MKLEKGIKLEPSKDLIYGVEGVGKSSLAATYPSPIIIDCEGSTSKLNVSRLSVRTWSEFKQAVDFILSDDKDAIDCETAIIDTVDWLEKMVISEILVQDKEIDITNHQAYGFGKGDVRIKGFFDNEVIPILEKIMRSGKNVVLVSHSTVKPFNDPINGSYDYYAVDMTKKAAASIRQWAHNVFFLNYKTTVTQGKGIDKNKAFGGKDVYVHTQRTPQYEAKRRDPLKNEIKVIEGVNPYMQIIGTEQLRSESESELRDAISDMVDAKTEDDLKSIWTSNKKLQKIESFINAKDDRKKQLESESNTEEDAK